MNPESVFSGGIRQREIHVEDLCPSSGRLLPEFDKRRSIKDMFSRAGASSKLINGKHDGEGKDNRTTAHSAVAHESSPSNSSKRKTVADPAPASSSKKTKSESTTGKGRASNGQQTLGNFFKSTRPVERNETKVPAASLTSSPSRTPLASTASQFSPTNNTKVSPCSSAALPNDNESTPAAMMEDAHSKLQASPSNRLNTPKVELQKKVIESQVSCSDSRSSLTHKLDDTVIEQMSFSELDFEAVVEANIRSRSQWGELFKPRAPPLCEGHQEPCMMMVSKKKGFNCGRSFWICARYVKAAVTRP